MVMKTLLFVCVTLLAVGFSFGARDLKTLDISEFFGAGGRFSDILDTSGSGNPLAGFLGDDGDSGSSQERFGGFIRNFREAIRGGPGEGIVSNAGLTRILEQIESGDFGFLGGLDDSDGNY
eukprot:TRINITY_DN3060_c0_g3_i7.p2 TRINITY_DN3060_c0_g3~~TRINITY_DN3060_c0_g3_i7.p2  ORF type:complete len:121 (-),score=23.06 TRINITY_DN3060_c0_g3_i7:373-735(-)